MAWAAILLFLKTMKKIQAPKRTAAPTTTNNNANATASLALAAPDDGPAADGVAPWPLGLSGEPGGGFVAGTGLFLAGASCLRWASSSAFLTAAMTALKSLTESGGCCGKRQPRPTGVNWPVRSCKAVRASPDLKKSRWL